MVGVWIEPVIAQLMMILLAIDVSFPLETVPKTADLANASAVSAVSYPAFSAPATIIRAGAAPSLLQAVCHDIPKTDIPKTAEFCRQDGHNCTLKPKFRRLKRLASPRVYIHGQPVSSAAGRNPACRTCVRCSKFRGRSLRPEHESDFRFGETQDA